MTKPVKILATVFWVIAIATGITVLILRQTSAAKSSPGPTVVDAGYPLPDPTPAAQIVPRELPVLYDAPQFSLTDQNNNTVTNTQLQGHPWVADFIFTQCSSLCPIMSARLSGLQDKINPQVKFVSFSVDPEHDTPAALLQYANQYKAQPGRWIFLTGPLKVETQIVSGMKMYFAPADGANPILHDQHFVLVDAQGHVRGVYDSNVTADTDQLVTDAHSLLATGGGGSK